MGYKVVVAGATGNVGREMLNILAEREFPVDEIAALASRKSLGTEISFGDKTVKTKDLDTFDFTGWDIALFADVSDDASVYAKVANSFRAPTIQGRDVAFFSPPSVAQSENITSYEVGFKSELADRTVRLNGAAYYYTVEDPQFTAVGGAGNLVQLINANKGEAWGLDPATGIGWADAGGGGTTDLELGGFHVVGVQVGQLDRRDLLELRLGDERSGLRGLIETLNRRRAVISHPLRPVARGSGGPRRPVVAGPVPPAVQPGRFPRRRRWPRGCDPGRRPVRR